MSETALPKLELIPWDFTSEDHAERMYLQRCSCGWRQDEVDKWRALSKEGTKMLYWIMLREGLPDWETLLSQHTDKYPKESSPIKDTATTQWLQPREPSNREFIPVGHIAVDLREEENKNIAVTEDNVVWIAGLYISWALQRGGIGKEVMRQAEIIAAGPPLNGKVVVLDTMAKEQQMKPAFIRKVYVDQGNPAPAVSSQEWYERQGYVPFHLDEAGYMWLNPEGEREPMHVVFLKKTVQ